MTAGEFERVRVLVVALGVLVVFGAAESSRAAFPGQNGRIAFSRDGDVWSVAADGSDEMNLTDHEALDADQRWSADGTKIVFTSDRSGNRDVWVMDADGGNPTQVTTDPARVIGEGRGNVSLRGVGSSGRGAATSDKGRSVTVGRLYFLYPHSRKAPKRNLPWRLSHRW